MSVALASFQPRLAARRRAGAVFASICFLMTCSGFVVLMALLWRVFEQGWSWLTPQFLTNDLSVLAPESAGIRSALFGSVWLVSLAAFVAVPLGIGAAIYLAEFARPGRLNHFIQVNIANLAGVPSIVYGLLGLAVFVRWMHLGRSVLAGALTLSLLVLPVIVIVSREALAAVPNSIRLAAYAVGATRWQVVRSHVLPAALPGIMTGLILALSRAVGEAAPLILIGAVNYIASVPTGPGDAFTALPIQVFRWSAEPQAEYHHLAAAGIIVLLVVLLSMNALAVGIRTWQQRHKTW